MKLILTIALFIFFNSPSSCLAQKDDGESRYRIKLSGGRLTKTYSPVDKKPVFASPPSKTADSSYYFMLNEQKLDDSFVYVLKVDQDKRRNHTLWKWLENSLTPMQYYKGKFPINNTLVAPGISF